MSIIVMSVGGSIIVPDKIDSKFLTSFRKLALDFIEKGNKLVIVCGGGKLAREYVNDANKITKISKDDSDWVGIMATRLNAELIRSIFSEHANPKVVYNPEEKVRFEKGKSMIIASGYKPGWSTDYDAILLAHQLKADSVINLTDVDYVYDKDPRKYKDAQPLKEMTWKQMKDIVGGEWKPGLNMPFDPVASKKAEGLNIKVTIINGSDIDNIKACIENKTFRGTTIR